MKEGCCGNCGCSIPVEDKTLKIAAELAHRDMRIAELTKLLNQFQFRAAITPQIKDGTTAYHYWGPTPDALQEIVND